MAMISRSQSQRSSRHSGGKDMGNMRGHVAKNKDELKSDGDSTMSKNPAVRQDQYGSRHNVDEAKKQQRRGGTPGGPQDLNFRESAQDEQPTHHLKNKLPGRRFKVKKKSQTVKRKR